MIKINDKKDIMYVTINGEINYEEGEELFSSIIDKCFFSKALKVVLNMSEIEYISSRGISVIIRIYKYLKDNGKEFSIYNPKEEVMKLLKITRINEIIKIEGELDAK